MEGFASDGIVMIAPHETLMNLTWVEGVWTVEGSGGGEWSWAISIEMACAAVE